MYINAIKKIHQCVLKILTLSTLGSIFSRQHTEKMFSENRFNISCKLSHMETISWKCQILFSGKKNDKNIINLSSAKLAQRVEKLSKITILTSTKGHNYWKITLSAHFLYHNLVLVNRCESAADVSNNTACRQYRFWTDCKDVSADLGPHCLEQGPHLQ